MTGVHILKYSLCCVVLLVLAACSSNEMYYGYRSFPKSVWNKDNICRFDVPVTDTTSTYTAFVEIRNNTVYAYRNLWLFIDFQTPSGDIRRDTLNCELADAYGKWNGSGISQYSLSLPYEEQFRFPHAGTYIYRVTHGMRDDDLNGISDIGIKIVRTDNQ